MQLWPIFTTLLANVATSSGKLVDVSPSRRWWAYVCLSYVLLTAIDAAACADICYTTKLIGFGPGGVSGCTCSGSQQGVRTGAGSCSCGQCYEKTQGVVYGFAINANGTCTYGQDCGTCDYSTNSSKGTSGMADSTPSPAPATSATSVPAASTSPASVTSAPPSDPDASTPSPVMISNNTPPSTDSTNSTSTDGKMDSNGRGNDISTWQIVLAICCTVLIFVVAFVAVCTCYCKARSRLYEHEDDHTNYYNQYLRTIQPWVYMTTGPGFAKRTAVAV